MDDKINEIEKTYRELTRNGRKIIRLFLGNPLSEGILFPPELLKKSYNSCFDHQTYKPDPKGLATARNAIANYYAEQKVKVDPEHIIITSGTSESFFYLFSHLACPGDEILSPRPSYPLFEPIAALTHIRMVPYQLKENENWEMDIQDLKNRTTNRTKAILLVSPHNPTGSVILEKQIQEVVEWANERRIPIICDEVFSEFYFGEGNYPRVIRVSKPDLCFTLNGISKMLALPALKLSWIVVTGKPDAVHHAVDALETTADTFLSCHYPIQQSLPMLFEEGREFLENYKSQVRQRRDAFVQSLVPIPGISFVPPQGGFYLMVKLIKKLDMTEKEFVIGLMRQKGVFVHPGYFYDYEEGIHFVVSFLQRTETTMQALGKMDDYFKDKY